MFKIHPAPLHSSLTTRITSIQGCGRSRREHASEGPLKSSPPPESSHDKALVNPPAVEPPIAKYTKKDLQRILRTVLKARALPSDGTREKPLKARSPDVYRGKSHMECYNFCQQCEDHFATARAKGPNRIPFAAFFLRDRITSVGSSTSGSMRLKAQSPSPGRGSRPSFVKA